MKNTIRVRFAPSPTGELHLGNARTAIFNWLFARRLGGTFILRIEDTDQERSKSEYQRIILEDLRWLGMDWDEGPEKGGAVGPYLQSERLSIYRTYAERLKDAGHTYECYCLPEELEARRKEAQERGSAPRYDNRCRLLKDDQKKKFTAEGRKSVIRFKVEPERVLVRDLVRGDVEFDTSLFGDFVIFKSDGFPTFHFAVAVDDGLMNISHVIRGEDHLPNTPRHVLLFRAMGFSIPVFAHLSMISGPDGSRLSKRHGATSVGHYRREGYLPDALMNYLALLGWSSGDNQEIFSREELVSKFSIERVVGSSAIFDPQKLQWVGEQHLRRAPVSDVSALLIQKFPEKTGHVALSRLDEFVQFMIDRAGTLNGLMKELEVFLIDPALDSDEAKKIMNSSNAHRVLESVCAVLEKDWTSESFPVKSISGCQKELGVSGAEFYGLFRVVLTGQPHGPELKEFCPRLGKNEVMRRLRKGLDKIK